MANGNGEWKLWIFSPGDLISLAGVTVMAGVMLAQVNFNGKQIDSIKVHGEKVEAKVFAIESTLPQLYVPKAEYREDLRDIKTTLRRIEDKLDDHEKRSNSRT